MNLNEIFRVLLSVRTHQQTSYAEYIITIFCFYQFVSPNNLTARNNLSKHTFWIKTFQFVLQFSMAYMKNYKNLFR